MHKSRLAGFIIDCKTEDLHGAARFWGAALNMELHGLNGEEGENYVRLMDADRGLHVEVQKVRHDSRVHLDIETDDIEAEAARLERLGAKKLQKFPRWWVMEAPTGQRFCVVQAKAADFAQKANRWEQPSSPE
jgi:predicted enzyme related to lactoylglutathione lyase